MAGSKSRIDLATNGDYQQPSLPNVQDCMPLNLALFYNGAPQTLIDGKFTETLNAGTGKVICQVPTAGAKDTEAALQAAHNAFPAWKATTPNERARLLRKFAQILREHASELAMLDALNIGSPIKIMQKDAGFAADYVDFYAGLIPAVTGTVQDQGTETLNYVVREPLGVVARIVASNHPLMFAAAKIAAPIAVGNTVVIKSPEQAPLSLFRLAELIRDLFPPGVVNLLHGGVDCGKILSTHPVVRKITLIGSVPTAKLIARAAADTLKLGVFELGGKNALIGFPDADIERLVDGIIVGMNWAWCGQSCGSTSRVFLHDSIHDLVLEKVVEKLKQQYTPGDPLELSTTMGAMVSGAAQRRVQQYVELGLKEGARLVTGGKVPDTPTGGFFFEPTIFADVRQSMRIAQEEIFGPVMSVLRWTDERQMIGDVNSVELGLSGAVYTSDIGTMIRTTRAIEAGTVWANTVGTHFFGCGWGGYKESGIGREDCIEEMLEMTQTKCIHIKL